MESKLCASLAQALGLAPGAVRADARLDELLPLAHRRELWSAWERQSGLPLPALDYRFSTKMSWFAGGFVAALFLFSALRTVGIHVPGSTMTGGVLGLLLGAAGLRWLAPRPVELPPGVHTVGSLAARILAREA
ncbi:MAG: hypothetical protein IT163_14610 [Bryobacterales bacterium]|nr:hypothetical protein [Bryobacterales bacterium]